MQYFVAVLIWACALCTAFSATNPEESIAPLELLTRGSNEFNTDLFKEISKEKKNENLISSPLSVYIALSMAAYGAEGVTFNEMHEKLNLPANKTIAFIGFQDLLHDLSTVKDAELKIANQICVAKNFSLKHLYQLVMKEVFRTDMSELDINKPIDAAKTVNDRVDRKTYHKIPTILQPDDINKNTRMVLLNAIYLKSQWAYEFKKKFTGIFPFFIKKNEKKRVLTMVSKSTYLYGKLEDLKAQFIEIPYKNQDLKMVIILPNEVDGLRELEKNLQFYNYNKLASVAHKRDIALFLPKFKIESSIDLYEPLNRLNLTNMFTDSANFKGISDADLKIGKVLQKAYIEVNEEGGESADPTAALLGFRTSQYPSNETYLLRVNKPFHFFIVKSKTVLFRGHVIEPQI